MVDQHIKVRQKACNAPQRADFQSAVRRPMTATPTEAPSRTCVTESMVLTQQSNVEDTEVKGLRMTCLFTGLPLDQPVRPLKP